MDCSRGRPLPRRLASHRWADRVPSSACSYGLRRSEILALRWDDLDTEVRVPCGSTRASWPHGPAQRGATPRTSDPAGSIPLDDETLREFARRRAAQAAERLARRRARGRTKISSSPRESAGSCCPARSTGHSSESSSTPSSHASPPTGCGTRAATHMVQGATDLGELRAIADLLGHSPEMLMNTYAHALPQSQSAVVERIGRRTT